MYASLLLPYVKKWKKRDAGNARFMDNFCASLVYPTAKSWYIHASVVYLVVYFCVSSIVLFQLTLVQTYGLDVCWGLPDHIYPAILKLGISPFFSLQRAAITCALGKTEYDTQIQKLGSVWKSQ